ISTPWHYTYWTYRTYLSYSFSPKLNLVTFGQMNKPNLITPHGGYRQLKSFQHAELVYDATVKFCERFIDPRSRTYDQMVQAARSGRQNIAEGSQASGTSKNSS
ncbi:MAG TPA: four helix bundle protein, partial [Pyrinomonadaceae bacterium]|nr:four helix bundle protein [Pyrinomonadaceae bacterium]